MLIALLAAGLQVAVPARAAPTPSVSYFEAYGTTATTFLQQPNGTWEQDGFVGFRAQGQVRLRGNVFAIARGELETMPGAQVSAVGSWRAK